MKNILIMVSIILISLGTGFAGSQIFSLVSASNQESKKSDQQSSVDVPNEIEVAAEWSEEPKSISDMIEKSDAIVIGRIKEKKDKNNNPVILQPIEDDNTIVYTEYDFKIKSTLKGNIESKKLDLINYGGLNSSGQSVTWEGIEKLNDNKTYLLFLEEIKSVEGMESDPRIGKFRPLDGPAGTYFLSSRDSKLLKKLELDNDLTVEEIQETLIEVEHRKLNIQNQVIKAGLAEIIHEIKKSSK